MTAPTPAPSIPDGEKLDFKRIFPIFIIVIVDLLALTVIIPMLPLFAVTFGADPLAIGLLSTVFPLFQLVGGPVLGSLSDRYGRKPVLIVSQVGTFVGLLMLGFANVLWILFASRILDGFTGGNIVTAQAAITDSTNERTRAQGLGLIGAAFGIGFVLGPAISGVALALTGNDFRVPAFIAAGFSLLSIVLTTFWFKETLAPDAHRSTARREPLLRRMAKTVVLPGVGILVALMFMQHVVFGGLEALLALFNLNRLGMSASSNAVVFVFVGVILVAVQGKYIGPWSRKYGERRLILAGLTLLAVGILLTALTPQVPVPWYSSTELVAELSAQGAESTALTGITSVALPPDGANGWLGLIWLLVAMVPCTIGAGLLSPSINSLISKSVPAAEIGGALGVSASMVSLANVIAPVTGGAMFQAWGSSAPFLAGGVVLAVLLFVSVRRLPSPKPVPAG
ncbi:MAG: MFS transporter [Chloroflexi bacterium]|nr:MFS transporter [Chloroflexota bacterium]